MVPKPSPKNTNPNPKTNPRPLNYVQTLRCRKRYPSLSSRNSISYSQFFILVFLSSFSFINSCNFYSTKGLGSLGWCLIFGTCSCPPYNNLFYNHTAHDCVSNPSSHGHIISAVIIVKTYIEMCVLMGKRKHCKWPCSAVPMLTVAANRKSYQATVKALQ